MAHAHTPLAQNWPGAQARLQAPQWALFAWVSTHIPLHGVSPPAQIVTTQTPSVHVWPEEQARPHAPQLELSELVFTQDPPQRVPLEHAHAPPAQNCPGEQTRPQEKHPDGDVPHSREPQSLSSLGCTQVPSTHTSRVQVSASLAQATPFVTGTQRPPSGY